MRDLLIFENLFGFMYGRSTIETVHLIKRLIEFYRDRKKDLHMVFIDFEKVYDRVQGKCFGSAWTRTHHRSIFGLLNVCMREQRQGCGH